MHRVVFTVAVLAMCTALREQSYAVKGRLICGAAPAANIRVKLYDTDTGLDPDDLLDQGYTDANGEFSLAGGTTETTMIDPLLIIYHQCNDVTTVGSVAKPGSRMVSFRLPSKYITNARMPTKTMNIGVLNLELLFPEEGRVMIVS
ncbi:Transthyretin-like [Parelaphostrongylus tenuis]|uniref:Transthyretin-like n=1 Tax=Parelaphostrongylus tenuis TaxID=148309 RepID=A0AAD5QHY4_PARTN|nr:Transthyretin-like [Parelaphostrongylus tenuis]